MTLSNCRSLPIPVTGVSSAEQAETWLGKQSETVRRVTKVCDSGMLVQCPFIEDGTYVDPTAQLIGGVIVRSGCYVGPFAIVRLDEKPSLEPLVVGQDSNIQDCAIVHSTTQSIGSRVIVAHQAIVHGAVIEDDVTIYIQAVADGDGTVIGRGSFLHQGAYVGKGIRVPGGRYVAPGVKVLTQNEADRLPAVPDALIAVRNHVLEHNRAHVATHRTEIR
jgi:carbonic anhydrase/acetyltransferase-like protein (isoleucine patch superfamily)